MSNTSTERLAAWQQLIAEQEQSSLSQRQFCKERGIADSTMSTYRSKLKKENNKIQSSFSSVTPIELQPTASKSAIKKDPFKITLPNGFSCDITPDTDLPYLKRLLGVLLSC